MPTVHESQLLFSYLKFWSNFYIFPFEVNPLSGKIYNLSPLKATIWKVLYYIYVIHSIFNFTHILALYILYPDRVVLYHLPVVFIGAIVPFFFHLTYTPAFMDNNHTVKRVYNELFDEKETRGRPRKWKDLNITEFLGIYGMNAMLSCVYVGYLAVICVEFNMSHLVINIGLFKQFRSNVAFIALAYFFEAFFSAMFLINAGFFLSLNFLVVSKVEADMDHIRRNLRRCWRNMTRVRNLVCTFKQSQLYIQLFNIINACFLQVVKMGSIMAAIIEGYIGLRCQSQQLVVIFCIYCHLSTILMYCYAFQCGYSVVVRQRNAKRAILAASKSIPRDARREALQALKSVRCVGIEVGQFHEIERNSPIVFIDYVER